MSTPHLDGQPGDYAADVIMPGDPARARRIAQRVLDSPRLITQIRGIVGYTGTVDGRPLSVVASGMGMPSITIYATELVQHFGVRRIVRVGTCGGLRQDVRLRDVVLAAGAHTDSAMSGARIPGVTFAHTASYPLLEAALTRARAATERDEVHVGTVLTTDHFYLARPLLLADLARHGTLAVEMEAAALYAVAAAEQVDALAVLTVSDLVGSSDALTSAEREAGFDHALDVALGALTAAGTAPGGGGAGSAASTAACPGPASPVHLQEGTPL